MSDETYLDDLEFYEDKFSGMPAGRKGVKRKHDASVKGGKEANVYRCQAHPRTGDHLLAAKVYRPRQFRNLRNDMAYRDGRDILTPEGHAVKRADQRLMRAVSKKTAFGKQVHRLPG